MPAVLVLSGSGSERPLFKTVGLGGSGSGRFWSETVSVKCGLAFAVLVRDGSGSVRILLKTVRFMRFWSRNVLVRGGSCPKRHVKVQCGPAAGNKQNMLWILTASPEPPSPAGGPVDSLRQ